MHKDPVVRKAYERARVERAFRWGLCYACGKDAFEGGVVYARCKRHRRRDAQRARARRRRRWRAMKAAGIERWRLSPKRLNRLRRMKGRIGAYRAAKLLGVAVSTVYRRWAT